MRRSLVVLAILVALALVAGPVNAPARAAQLPTGQTQTTAGTCALTSYTLTGSFSRLGGAATFSLGATGSCVGVPSGVATVNITFNSIGPWSCAAGTATGSGAIQTPGNGPQIVSAALVNTGGEYVVQIFSLTSAATGNITTLPVPCEEGATQTTIGGTGTLTYAT